MRTQLLIGGVMIAATALLVYTAKAEPAKEGETFIGQAFMCDTEEQVHALYDAAQDKSGNALAEAYLKLNAQLNEKGEPACVFGSTTGVLVTKIEHLGIAYGSTGHKFNTWLVDIKANNVTGSIFYGEVIAEAAPHEAPKS